MIARIALAGALCAVAGCCDPAVHVETPTETCARVALTMPQDAPIDTPYRGVDRVDSAGVLLAVGHTAEQAIPVVPGSTIREIRIRVVADFHSTLAGAIGPHFDLHRTGAYADAMVARTWDPNWIPDSTETTDPLAAERYSQAHDIVMTLSERVTTDAGYSIVIAGETGDGQAAPVILCGTSIDGD
jgi:hypothetical protein